MVTPFPMQPEIERRTVGPFSWQNLVWLSDTNAWDDTSEGHNMSELAHE